MGRAPELRTDRLLLRRWLPADLEPYAALNADSEVREHFQSTMTRQECESEIAIFEERFDEHGYGLWAVEVPGVAPCIGFIGLDLATFDAPFTPAVEVGWRLARDHWGKGYASEGARAALQFGFDTIGLDEIVSVTTPRNVRYRISRTTSDASLSSRNPR
ncbi:MAG: GNAT family N-acetyltransferase [Acidimicrobiia bacterium]